MRAPPPPHPLHGNLGLAAVLPQIMLFPISLLLTIVSEELLCRSKVEIYDHTGLGCEPRVLCITGSQEKHDLSMNEDRKSLPVDPPEAL